MDYIRRDAIKWHRTEHEDRCHNEIITVRETVAYKEEVDRIPSEDVQEVKRGKWEEVEVSYIEDMYDKGNLPEAIVSMYCPICERYHNEVYWYGNPTENINFCPNCGAKMHD
jgi:hypothetical protein